MPIKVVRWKTAAPERIVIVRERVSGNGFTADYMVPPDKKVLWFEAPVTLDQAAGNAASAGGKAFTTVVDEDGQTICDYRDVRIRGYLSIFRDAGNPDRDGEFVKPGAFDDTLKTFALNPVMLMDHRNSVATVAGSFTTFRQDAKGLFVEGTLSNAPGNIDLRFKVAEGHVKTLSMGGLFYFEPDGRAIFKVDLVEGSIVAVPADPGALFSTRALSDSERKMFEKRLAA